MTNNELTLSALGWNNHFQAQMTLEELETHRPVRVAEVQRSHVDTLSPQGPARLPMSASLTEARVAVGDWLLLDPEGNARIMDRASVLHRRAAGTEAVEQTIAANIDTLLIVSSCNADFNIARLERYMALARQAGIEPVVLLTKADLCDDPAAFRKETEAALRNVLVETLNACDAAEVQQRLGFWTRPGQTLALLGSSGVGKTTLTNALTGRDLETQAMRQDDAKGRHTTTARSMHPLPGGAWLVDTPGMRELRMLDVADGIDAVFDDIIGLALDCRFRDCEHETEPGCAVQDAIQAGTMDPARLQRWRKLQREDRHNSESVAQTRARAKKLGKVYAHGKSRGDAKRGH